MKRNAGLFLMVLVLLICGCKKDPLFTDNGTFTDMRDQHVYRSVKIGEQIWMAENLAWLPSVGPSLAGSDSIRFYYVYGYQGSSPNEAKSTTNYTTYGVLYNWEAAKIACPAGWHLPGDEDWWILSDFLDNEGITVGGKMKETGTAHWLGPNTGATNESGFTALPGGERYFSGGFSGLGEYAEFWSSLEYYADPSFIWIRILSSTVSYLQPDTYDHSDGFSVRCIKNP